MEDVDGEIILHHEYFLLKRFAADFVAFLLHTFYSVASMQLMNMRSTSLYRCLSHFPLITLLR